MNEIIEQCEVEIAFYASVLARIEEHCGDDLYRREMAKRVVGAITEHIEGLKQAQERAIYIRDYPGSYMLPDPPPSPFPIIPPPARDK